MVHIGVALDAEQLGYSNAAEGAAAAQVVAQQIDDHQVLCAVLGAVAQLFGQSTVRFGIDAPGAGALDRAGFHLTVADLEEAFGGQAEQAVVRRFEIGGKERSEERRVGKGGGSVGWSE